MFSPDSQASSFLPAAFLLFGLALVSLGGVFIPQLRNFWHWGRTAETVPISRSGCSLMTLAFITMGLAPAGLALGRVAASHAVLTMLAGFILFIVAGALDCWKANKR